MDNLFIWDMKLLYLVMKIFSNLLNSANPNKIKIIYYRTNIQKNLVFENV